MSVSPVGDDDEFAETRCTVFFCFILTQEHVFFIAFRGRGREKKTLMDVRETHQSVASHTHMDRGSNLRPR